MSVSIVTTLHEWESVLSANKCWNVHEYWFPYTADIDTTDISVLRDGPLENSWGGGGGGGGGGGRGTKKKIPAREN